MNDLEERLRADFRAAAAQVEDRTDADDALLAGQRARSSRRVARTVGVAALAAAVGLVGWGFLRVPPVLGGYPDPMGTISAVPTIPSTTASPYVPADPMSATFHLGGRLNGQVPTYDDVRVAVIPTGDQVEVTVSLVDDLVAVEKPFTIASGEPWRVALDKHLVLSIVPGRPTWFQGVESTAKGSITYPQPLTGINATAYLTGFLGSGGSEKLRGFLWRGIDGVAHDSLGNIVPSAEVSLATDTYWVYRDAALDVMGIVPEKEGGSYSLRLSDVKAGDLVHGGIGTRPETGGWSWTQFGTLPPGAHDIEVELAVPGGEWTSATLPDGWVFVLARAQTDKTSVIWSISYTDAAGKRVAHRE